jgi:hypothetical protein
VVPGETRELTATVDLVADMATINPFDFFVEESAANYPFAYEPGLAGELEPYLRTLPDEPVLNGYLAGIARAGKSTTEFIIDLNRKLSGDIAYRVRMEPGVQTPAQTLQSRSGSCRDTGWLLVRSCAGSASRRASFRATSSSCGPTWRRPTVRPGPRRISAICTPGPRSTCPAPVGSASIRLRGCSRARDIFRWRRHPPLAAPLPSPAPTARPR